VAEEKRSFLKMYLRSNLLLRILIGLILGAICGLIFGEKILWVGPFGDFFIRLLKMIVLPVVITSLIVGSASIHPSKLGKVGVKVLIIYLITWLNPFPLLCPIKRSNIPPDN